MERENGQEAIESYLQTQSVMIGTARDVEEARGYEGLYLARVLHDFQREAGVLAVILHRVTQARRYRVGERHEGRVLERRHARLL
ncbi:hypothetical protein [Hydrogenophaga palleronii]|uniref:hypothetical protein n=1 Tax=Hydrogenophaga palleronii TaxID=65655 RepID=UPI000B2149DE|nr:hypothetical protein [Hydrogenophaga palleronii]